MKFFERPTIYHCVCRDRTPPKQWLAKQWSSISDVLVKGQLQAECMWLADRRPYYSVWPAVAESLAKVTLDLDSDLIRLPLPRLLIRFSESAPLELADRKLRSILVSEADVSSTSQSGGRGMVMWCDFGESRNGIPIFSYRSLPLVAGQTVEQILDPSLINLIETDSSREESNFILADALRIVVAITLLGDDPDLIEPDVLDRDRLKYEETGDNAIVDRAHRRGKIGWHVGRHIEVSPHYRRAHFGIRWTEKGRAVPKIVPIKGAVVKRKKITDVPTGYIDDETRKKIVDADKITGASGPIADNSSNSDGAKRNRQRFDRSDRHRSGIKRHGEG